MANSNDLTGAIIGAAIAVHRALGPGLLESAYEACLAFELVDRGIQFERQKALPIIYREVEIDCGYRMDFVVQDQVIVELKSVNAIEPIHKAQLLSYLRLANRRLGLLLNFNVKRMQDGIFRMINDPT